MWDVVFLVGVVLGIVGIMATMVFAVRAQDISRWLKTFGGKNPDDF